MAVRIWPVNAVSGAPAYSGRMLRQSMVAPLLDGATGGRPLGTRSGVRAGTPADTVTASSSTWTVKPHAGILDVQSATEAGPYGYAIDANVTGSVNPAHATLSRIDLISLRLDDPAESDGSGTPAVVPVYTAGTASGSPLPPATPARSMAIAQIIVPQSGGGSPSTIWVAPILSMGVIPCRTVGERNGLPTAGASTAAPVLAMIGTALYVHAGSGWVSAGGVATPPAVPIVFASTWTDHGTVSGLTLPPVTGSKLGNRVLLHGSVKRIVSSPTSTTATLGTLDASLAPTTTVETIVWTSGGAARLQITPVGSVIVDWPTSQTLTADSYRIDLTGVSYLAAP